MATQILDTDIMILQKEGTFDVHDPSYDETDYPNLKYDLKHFHFLGKDLRYSVENYIYEEHKYVRIDGDIMYGNLSIVVPKNTDLGVENNPTFILEGYRNTGTFASIMFRNTASSTDRTMTLNAVSHTDSNVTPYYFQFDKKTRLTEHSELVFKESVLDDPLAKNSVTAAGKGYLRHLVVSDSDPSITDDDSYKRVEWNDEGGGLLGGNPEKYIIQWTGSGGTIRANKELITWEGDHAEYDGDILIDTDMVNKGYVDSVASGYIPLMGTEPGTQVEGKIDFTTEGSLNATFGEQLVFTAHVDNNPEQLFLTIGGPFQGPNDSKSYLYRTLKLDPSYSGDVKIEDVPYPDTVPGSTVDDNNAIPKKYVDDGDEVLQDQINGLTEIASPPGMINAYVGSQDPTGWYICNGRTINSAEDPALYALVGSHIPDLSGRWLVQRGGSVGNALGNPIASSTAIPKKAKKNSDGAQYLTAGNHSHYINDYQIARIMNRANQDGNGYDASNYVKVAWSGGSHKHTLSVRKYGNSGRNGLSPTDDNGGDSTHDLATNQSISNHSHSLKYNTNTNASNANAAKNVLTDPASSTIYDSQFDSHTRPDSYTINWIIKR